MGKLIKLLDSDIKDKIVNDLIESLTQIQWTKASIPVGEHKHIFDDLKKLLKEASEFSKIKVQGRNGYLHRKGFDKILDISKCWCFTRVKSIQDIQWYLCKCQAKISQKEISFLCCSEILKEWFHFEPEKLEARPGTTIYDLEACEIADLYNFFSSNGFKKFLS